VTMSLAAAKLIVHGRNERDWRKFLTASGWTIFQSSNLWSKDLHTRTCRSYSTQRINGIINIHCNKRSKRHGSSGN
jgi:O-methyltransferase involved in polyketide biosynthesis